jgi:hypothetical protein
MMAAAERDLKPFLSSAMWERMWPETIRTMVQDSLMGAKKAAAVIDNFEPSVSAQRDDDTIDHNEGRPDEPRG